MMKWTSIALAILAGCVCAGIDGWRVTPPMTTVSAQTIARAFELRTYTAHPGKFEAMKRRFREHILPLFKKHNMELVGFWTYADPPASENTLVYILAHQSRAAAEKNWKAFLADPDRVKVWTETEKDGPINLKVESVFLNPLDVSPIK
jgi:hypothetical protein